MRGAGHQITKEEFPGIGRMLGGRLRKAGVAPDDIGDLVKEIFEHAQDGLNRGKYDGHSSLSTWVVGIGKQRFLKWRDRSRAAKRTATEVALDDPEESATRNHIPSRTGDPFDRLQLKQVIDSLCELPSKLRPPLVLVTEGRPYKEVALALVSAGR